MKNNNRINKRKLIFKVAKKINHNVHHLHITNVISLFVSELTDELKLHNQISIPNFGILILEKSKPRKFFHIKKRRFAMSEGNNLIKMKLSKKLRIKIIENLDIIKTFLED